MENIKSCTGKIYFTSFEEARDILKEMIILILNYT